MLITKFNRLIRNKLLWGAFAVMISVGFAGQAVISRWYDDDSAKHGVEGTLYGKDVYSRDFRQSMFFELGMRDSSRLTADQNKQIRDLTWRRIAALKRAEIMGIFTSDMEVKDAITQDKSFMVNGVFHPDMYRNIVRSQLHITVEQFERYLREQMTIQKLMIMLGAATWLSPSEMADKLRNLTDEFVVEYTILDRTNYVLNVFVTTNDAARFFEQNQEIFRIPEKINASYVSFPVAEHIHEKAVTEEDVVEYYDSHLDAYTTADTNGAEVVTPLDNVRDEILTFLKHQDAAHRAKDAATEFVVAMVPRKDGTRNTMESVATQFGMTVATTEYFALDEQIAGIDAGIEFNRAAFELDENDPERHFSDAIMGESNAYVVSIIDRQESRIPEFAEIVDPAMSIVRHQTEVEAFEKKASEIRQSLETFVRDGGSFATAADSFGLNVKTSETFTIYGGPPESCPELELLTHTLDKLDVGKVADPYLSSDKGTAVIAFVASREPGDPMFIQSMRPRLISALDRYRTSILYNEWTQMELNRAGFEDMKANTQQYD
ncbi:MAG: SurA N-terminal domain-containing protein [Lentisphaerae bacterium]|nr:SurA N-terminal domain-containing protein [Lentisphaerota bacterium]